MRDGANYSSLVSRMKIMRTVLNQLLVPSVLHHLAFPLNGSCPAINISHLFRSSILSRSSTCETGQCRAKKSGFSRTVQQEYFKSTAGLYMYSYLSLFPFDLLASKNMRTPRSTSRYRIPTRYFFLRETRADGWQRLSIADYRRIVQASPLSRKSYVEVLKVCRSSF